MSILFHFILFSVLRDALVGCLGRGSLKGKGAVLHAALYHNWLDGRAFLLREVYMIKII